MREVPGSIPGSAPVVCVLVVAMALFDLVSWAPQSGAAINAAQAQSPQTSCDARGPIRRVGRRRRHTSHGATQPDPCPPMPCSSPIS